MKKKNLLLVVPLLLLLFVTPLIVPFTSVAYAEVIGSVDTAFNLVGPDDKIVIEAFDDPKVKGVTCHLSRATTGGLMGSVGLAEDKSNSSLACRQVGPISYPKLKDGEEVFKKNTNIFFKSMKVVRFMDTKRNVIIYMVYSEKLIDGSPKNSISTVPVMKWTQ